MEFGRWVFCKAISSFIYEMRNCEIFLRDFMSQFVFGFAELSGLCILCALRIVLFCFEIMRIHSLRSSSAGIELKRCEELSESKGRNQCLCCPKLAIIFLIILHY